MITAACGNLFHFEDGKVRCMAKYEKWLKEENILLIQSWARDGFTDEQIAHNMGISYSTLREWKIKFPALSAALKKGKEVIDDVEYEVKEKPKEEPQKTRSDV